MFATVGWEWQFTPFTPVLFVAGTVMAAISAYAWRNRDAPGASAFAVLMAAASLWAVAYGLQLAGATEPTKRFWANVVHVGVAVVPVCWVCFSLQFTGRGRLVNRRAIVALSAIPAFYLALVWTNEYHFLVREPLGVELVADGLLVYRQRFGPAFWAHAIYGYGLIVAGSVLLVHLLVWSPTVYRRQVSLLVIGATLVVATNAIHHAGFNPIPNFDPTPFSFTVTGALFLVAIYHYQLLDLTPIARAVAVDALREGILILDERERVVDVNAAATRLLDVDADATIGRTVEDLLPDGTAVLEDEGDTVAPDAASDTAGTDLDRSDRSQAVASGERCREGKCEDRAGDDRQCDDHDEVADGSSLVSGGDGTAETELVVELGSDRRTLHCRSTPVVDVSGNRLGRAVVLRDVTRTRALQAEVTETMERLQRSNAELASFASVVSHDLREPLRTTENYLSLYEERAGAALDPADAELVSVARENARRGQEMIGDLLQYARIGPEAQTFEPVDCERVVGEVVEALKFEIEDTGATIDVGELPTVTGVEHLLRQLFQNLLANALAYSGDEPASIAVSADRTESGWRFAVSDDGVGIDPADRSRIFDLFTRADRTSSRAGTGMGLAICKRIVDAHDGSIDADATPGRGATITFSIPDRQPTDDAGAGRSLVDDSNRPVGTTGDR